MYFCVCAIIENRLKGDYRRYMFHVSDNYLYFCMTTNKFKIVFQIFLKYVLFQYNISYFVHIKWA